jgi:transcriptional regulator with XRE-family HTH domain
MLSEKIKQCRKAQGYSCSQIARRTGYPVSTIHNIESGASKDPHFKIVCAIAKALDISLDELADEVYTDKSTQTGENHYENKYDKGTI